MKNRFKELDLVDRVPEELWAGASDQDHPQEKEMQKGKMVVLGDLRNSWGKKWSESQGREGKIYQTQCRVPENRKERYEGLLKWKMQRNRGKQKNEKD